MSSNASLLIESFLIAGFPWISQLKNLNIHFKIQSFELKSIYNFFASLFGVSIYIQLNRLGTYDLLYWPNWMVFIVGAFILTLIYMFTLIYKYKEVNSNKISWPIITNFIVYVLIFCCLTSGFGLLETYTDHYVIKGIVTDHENSKIERAQLGVMSKNVEKYPDLVTLTKQDGSFSILIPKKNAHEYNEIEVIRAGYEEFIVQFGNMSSLKSLSQKILLEK
ncbi:hypothetical protein [Aquimarina sediminis]|uniref:hypothetical protein n=1 Tax=Aquimarina sediminis TaxID=2070536 RepID=UPI000CA05D85|nr:hypothetical protein [Aquimarina sediminis]